MPLVPPKTLKFRPLIRVDQHHPANQWQLIRNRHNTSFLLIYGSMGFLRSPNFFCYGILERTVRKKNSGIHGPRSWQKIARICSTWVSVPGRNLDLGNNFFLVLKPTPGEMSVGEQGSVFGDSTSVEILDTVPFGNSDNDYRESGTEWCISLLHGVY